jgi:hypothetical protein
MNGRFQMQGGKNWIVPKDINANRFLWVSHWLEIWSNHLCPSMGPNGGSVAYMDTGFEPRTVKCVQTANHSATSHPPPSSFFVTFASDPYQTIT